MSRPLLGGREAGGNAAAALSSATASHTCPCRDGTRFPPGGAGFSTLDRVALLRAGAAGEGSAGRRGGVGAAGGREEPDRERREGREVRGGRLRGRHLGKPLLSQDVGRLLLTRAEIRGPPAWAEFLHGPPPRPGATSQTRPTGPRTPGVPVACLP